MNKITLRAGKNAFTITANGEAYCGNYYLFKLKKLWRAYVRFVVRSTAYALGVLDEKTR